MITGLIRFSYLNAFEPKPNPSGDLKYSASLLVDKKDKKFVSQIKEAINKAVAKGIESGKFTKGQAEAKTFKIPLRDGDEEFEAENRGPEYKGNYFMNASNSNAPGVVGPDGKLLMAQEEFYSGCYGHVDISMYPYNVSGNRGIGVGLNNLMKKKDGDRLDGRMKAEDAFADLAEEVEDTEGDLE